MKLKLVSVHVPKTAGNSLAHALYDHFGNALAFDYAHDPANPIHDLSDPAVLDSGVRAVHGHFRGDRYSEYKAHHNSYHLTFIRNPVQNLISIYFFWKTWPGPGGDIFVRFQHENPTLLEFARKYPFTNLLTDCYFRNVDMALFDFIGSHEERLKGYKILSDELGFPFDTERRENVTPVAIESERREVENDENLLGQLRTLTKPDLDFYLRVTHQNPIK